jgi:hypothetical protein
VVYEVGPLAAPPPLLSVVNFPFGLPHVSVCVRVSFVPRACVLSLPPFRSAVLFAAASQQHKQPNEQNTRIKDTPYTDAFSPSATVARIALRCLLTLSLPGLLPPPPLSPVLLSAAAVGMSQPIERYVDSRVDDSGGFGDGGGDDFAVDPIMGADAGLLYSMPVANRQFYEDDGGGSLYGEEAVDHKTAADARAVNECVSINGAIVSINAPADGPAAGAGAGAGAVVAGRNGHHSNGHGNGHANGHGHGPAPGQGVALQALAMDNELHDDASDSDEMAATSRTVQRRSSAFGASVLDVMQSPGGCGGCHCCRRVPWRALCTVFVVLLIIAVVLLALG